MSEAITNEPVADLLSKGWKLLPPNPFYEAEFVCSLSTGEATLTISTHGGSMQPKDAQDTLGGIYGTYLTS